MVKISQKMVDEIIAMASGYEGEISVDFDIRCTISGKKSIMREFAAALGRSTVPMMQEFVDIMSTWNEHPNHISLGYIDDILIKQD